MRKSLLLVIFISFPAFGWENIEDEFSELNTAIHHIWTGGSWEQDGKAGLYRFLVAGGGYEHYKTKLYVQWLLHGSDEQKPSVLSTIEVVELNENPVYTFLLPKCAGSWVCGSIELEAINVYTSSKHQFNIKFTGIGKYVLTQKNL